MASRSVRSAVNRTADALVGRADLEVTAGGHGIEERYADALRGIPGVEHVSPSIQQTFRIAEGPGTGEAIRLLGIDFLGDRDVRDFSVFADGVFVSDPLRLVAQQNAILLPRSMAERLRVSEGNILVLRGPLSTEKFTVRGFLAGELTEAFGGQVALTDVYGLQALMHLGSRVHRIDLSLAEGAEVAKIQATVESIVDPGVAVRPPSLRHELRHSIMGVIDVSIWSLVFMATLLALLSTYAVVSLSVDRRLEELALLRVSGMEGSRIAILIITDGLLVAILSTALGLLVATLLGDSLVSLLSHASQNLQRLRIEPLGLRPQTIAVACIAGLPLSIIASLEPAIRVGHGSPMEVLAGQRYAEHKSHVRWSLVGAGILFAALSALAWFCRSGLPPAVRVFAVLAFAVLGLGFATGQLFSVTMPHLRNAFGRMIPRVGHLVASMLMERTLEAGLTVAVWAAWVGGAIAMISTIESVARSMDQYFSGWSGPNAVVVFAEDPLMKSARDRERLEPSTVHAIRTTRGVGDVAVYCDTSTMFRGSPVAIYNTPSEILERRGGLKEIFDNRAAALKALESDAVVVSRQFANRFGVRVSDTIRLEADSGQHEFRVGAIHSNFTGWGGSITMDDRVFFRFFGNQCVSPISVAFWADGALTDVTSEIRERAGDQSLFFIDGHAYSSLVRRIVSRYRSLLFLPLGLICLAGSILLINLLLGNVLARRRDLAILRASGGTAANTISTILVYGTVLGLIGTAIGLCLATYWSMIIADAIEDSMSWPIRWGVPWKAALSVSGFAGLSTVAASILPALHGLRSIPTGATTSDI